MYVDGWFQYKSLKCRSKHQYITLRKKCPYSELFWYAFSRILTEYGEIRSQNAGKCGSEELLIRTLFTQCQSSMTLCDPISLLLTSFNQQDCQNSSRTLIDNIFLNSIEFETFSGNLTSIISDHLPQLLILKDFHRKSIVTNNIVYERNYQLFNDNEFKNDLKKHNFWKYSVSSQPVSLICFTNKLIHC